MNRTNVTNFYFKKKEQKKKKKRLVIPMPYDFSDDSRSHTFINAHIVTQINIKE